MSPAGYSLAVLSSNRLRFTDRLQSWIKSTVTSSENCTHSHCTWLPGSRLTRRYWLRFYAPPDIQAGKLHYTAPERDEDPGASILRMVKLTQRGFKPTEDSIARAIGRFAAELVKQESHVDDALPLQTPEMEYTMKAKRCFRSCGYSWKHGRKGGQEDE